MTSRIVTVFDTETTSKYPTEARIVQYAHVCLLVPEFKLISSFSSVVKPMGFEIPQESTNIHGYTQEFCLTYGASLEFIVDRHLKILRASDEAWAYNSSYDTGVFTAECARLGKVYEGIEKVHCAMKPCVQACKLPFPSGKAGYKFPRLEEAYQHFFAKSFPGMHNALGDVFATIDVLRAVDPWGEAERLTGDKA